MTEGKLPRLLACLQTSEPKVERWGRQSNRQHSPSYSGSGTRSLVGKELAWSGEAPQTQKQFSWCHPCRRACPLSPQALRTFGRKLANSSVCHHLAISSSWSSLSFPPFLPRFQDVTVRTALTFPYHHYFGKGVLAVAFKRYSGVLTWTPTKAGAYLWLLKVEARPLVLLYFLTLFFNVIYQA